MPDESNLLNQTEDKGAFGKLHQKVLLDTRLSLGARCLHAVFLWLAWRSYDGRCETYHGQEALGEQLGIAARTVREYMQELEECGYIQTQRRGQGKPSRVILLPVVQNANPDRQEPPA